MVQLVIKNNCTSFMFVKTINTDKKGWFCVNNKINKTKFRNLSPCLSLPVSVHESIS